jgi:hypothetical protein
LITSLHLFIALGQNIQNKVTVAENAFIALDATDTP